LRKSEWSALYENGGSSNLFYSAELINAAVSTWRELDDLQVVIGSHRGSAVFAQPVKFPASGEGVQAIRFFRTPTSGAIEPLGIDRLAESELLDFIRFLTCTFDAEEILIPSASERFVEMLQKTLRASQVEIRNRKKGTLLHLPGSVDDYWAGLKSNHRNLLKRKLRKAVDAGLTFRVLSSDGATDERKLSDALCRLTELHRKRFDSLDRESFFTKVDIQQFHKHVLSSSHGPVAVDFIECLKDDQVVGSVYGISTQDDFVCLMTGFDPD